MQPYEAEDEYRVLQALTDEGVPLDTFHIYRGSRRISSYNSAERVREFFEHKVSRPVRDESRFLRCPICNVAMPPDTPRHLQTPDGQISRGHRFIKLRSDHIEPPAPPVPAGRVAAPGDRPTVTRQGDHPAPQLPAEGQLERERVEQAAAERAFQRYIVETGLFRSAVENAVRDGVLTRAQADHILSRS